MAYQKNKKEEFDIVKEVNIFNESYAATLSSKNQVTIPAKIRERINAEAGDQLVFSINEEKNVVVDVIKKDSLLSLFGSMPPKGEKLQKEWSEIRQQAREEKITTNNDD